LPKWSAEHCSTKAQIDSQCRAMLGAPFGDPLGFIASLSPLQGNEVGSTESRPTGHTSHPVDGGFDGVEVVNAPA